ncbi:NDR1/HIN1-like protein 6 [Rhododendron vialii]|uniref:NDR1/HIN1-like protein 6 n=1 Tax=Rhododendron vialii TaxID=182163 RepID=UPI00265DDAC7|nr:NDR1/HIN1-like protein 6 [Rhododendron vialii]
MAPRANMNGDHPSHNQQPPPPPQPQTPPPPPPNRRHNHHYYPPPPRYSSSASLKGCCCWLFLLFSFLLLLCLAVVLVVVLAVKPKKPQFDLQQVAVQYVGITPNPPSTTASTDPTLTTPTPTSSASVSLSIRMLFTAANDNKVGIKYGESRFTVMYRGIPLGKGTVPGFFQAAHSVRQVETTVAVDRVNLMQADAADLVRDASVNDRVELRVLGDVGAKIRILGVTSPGVQVSVDCAIVISPRKQALTYKQCGFDGLSV